VRRTTYRSLFRPGAALAIAVVFSIIAYRVNDRIEREGRRAEAIRAAGQGSPAAAGEALEPLLAASPDDSELLEAAVLASVRDGRDHKRIEELSRRWFEADRERLPPTQAYLRVLQVTNRPASEQIPVLEHWLALDPTARQRRLELASMYYIVGRFDDSIRESQAVLDSSDFDRTVIRLAIARAKFAKGDDTGAAVEADAILIDEPGHADTRLLRARIHQRAGEDRQTVAILETLPHHGLAERITILNTLGQSLTRLGRTVEADSTFNRLSRIQDAEHHVGDARQKPADWSFQRRAAASLLQANLPREAATLLSDAILRIGHDREALLLLADCHERLGDSTRARDARLDAYRPG
jgi:predicted Zn-dependent protease